MYTSYFCTFHDNIISDIFKHIFLIGNITVYKFKDDSKNLTQKIMNNSVKMLCEKNQVYSNYTNFIII